MLTTKKTKPIKNFLLSCNLQNLKEYFFTFIILILMLIILSNPSRFTSGTISGVKLFFNAVFPGLFPFMLLTKLLTELGTLYKISSKFDKLSYRLFGTPGVSIYAFLMSILSGYPIGAKIISDLFQKGQIDEFDAKKMTVFCTTSGPIFVIGAVGAKMLNNTKLGFIIYISHILSCLIIAITSNIIFRKKRKNNIILTKSSNIIMKNKNIFSYCVSETINSIFVVGAYITIFYLATELLDSLKIIDFLVSFFDYILNNVGIESNIIRGALYGIIEVTHGCKELSIFASTKTIAVICGLISFSGFSIIMQSMSFLKTAKIKTHNFVLTKCAHFITSILLCYALLIIF